MYIPDHFRETDERKIRELVDENPFCTLITNTSEGLIANHVPVLWKEDSLIGHLARANGLHEQMDATQEVLAVFHGGDAYISPNWYPSKAQHHRHVPTWNYRVVHIHGHLEFSHAADEKRAVVAQLTRHHEASVNGADAWQMRDAPPDYIDTMLNAIVAFTLRITRIDGKFKLSQNREDIDLEGAAVGLEASGQLELAKHIRRGGTDKR